MAPTKLAKKSMGSAPEDDGNTRGSLDAFFLRRSEATASKVGMPQGAVLVHDAVQNHDDEEKPKVPRTAPEDSRKSKKTKAGAVCSMCAQEKPDADGYFTGKSGKTFYCKSCSAIEARIKRLASGKQAMVLWKDMDAKDKQAFRLEKAELEGAALKDSLSVKLVQRYLETTAETTGGLGEYLPLSVYKHRGYDDEWISWIQDNAPNRQEGPGRTYALRVAFEKTAKELKNITESVWKPLPENNIREDGDNAEKPQRAPSSSSSSDSSEEDVDSSSESHEKSKRSKKTRRSCRSKR